ncbi:HIRAN domain-containing protein [Flaviaesturariibacter aridisoli]|uniref:HIRAN domain-containing protein n=1 Tax=Flaviaesturariibacter aridisoli TaxID=2545761 RepID=A0A4R4DWP2_9BACT|nr:HIRAN domain-containing protein [Flaviaesturariibacter aridisoli]TCZ67052.1 hypothetical protein E0486_16325 [Flaviaesturariibacter aridisoli]
MTRSTFLNRLIGIAGLGFFGLTDIQQLQKIYLLQCFVAGFRFHRGMELLPLLQEGDLLELRREPGNEHDPFAIALYWQQEMIGYLPKACNELLARLMDAKALSLLASITHLDRDVKPWEHVSIAVYFLQPEKKDLPPHTAYLTRLEKPQYHTRTTRPITDLTYRRDYAPVETPFLPHVLDECDRVIDLNGIDDSEVRHWFEKQYGHRRIDIPDSGRRSLPAFTAFQRAGSEGGGDYVLVPDNGIYTHMYHVDSIGWIKDRSGKKWLEFGWRKD